MQTYRTTDELCRHMKKKYELSAYADHKSHVDGSGLEKADIIQNPEVWDFSGSGLFSRESPEKDQFCF